MPDQPADGPPSPSDPPADGPNPVTPGSGGRPDGSPPNGDLPSDPTRPDRTGSPDGPPAIRRGPLPGSGLPGSPPPIGVRRSPWIPIGLVVTSIAILIVGTLLVLDITDTSGAGGPAPTTLSTEATRRAAVTAAAENYYQTLDKAFAANDPGLLDGLYTDEAPVANNQRTSIEQVRDGGFRIERTTEVSVRSINFISDETAELVVLVSITSGETTRVENGNVEDRVTTPRSDTRRMGLRYLDGQWKISSIREEQT